MTGDPATRDREIRALPDAGSVVIDSRAARALRTRGTPLTASGLLGCVGGFARGAAIYLVQRGVDGGQRAVAKGIAALSASEIEALMQAGAADAVIVGGDDLALF